ncbi:phenazine biosynthesis, PhzF family protein [Burkholderia territorii]|uniref:PhzF family phenazine biosynthesis protein n=1 Tax=Burkholderia territorii TaxID=1503055 RepID=UPI000757DD1C|nr:PhzF family phenazine biosynthesis protein [Burkholderia territorii]KUY96508.1 phenazine biosynthesis, PhzF family protein [Burkholderia territorii]KUZ18075.1 phenazine biosynthesis, PhzF family protein [Burkholderia territorii]
MTGRLVRFKQVDVFTSVPFKGNPLAVVFDADSLGDDAMLKIARWTNLSETTFVCTPTDPDADYRVRIFTTAGELPFAGHPTLGTAHAFLESGGRPRTPGRLIQQCGVGRVELREQAGSWAFAAPPARVTPLDRSDYAVLAAALRSDAIDFDAEPCAVDNGAPWLVVRLKSVDACIGLSPDPAALEALTRRYGMDGLAVYAPHVEGGPATFEIRCLMAGGNFGVGEDPVTGSANAALAGLLTLQQRRPGPSYTARQGTAIGRDGRIAVSYDQDGTTWIGGHVVTVVDGTFRSPV